MGFSFVFVCFFFAEGGAFFLTESALVVKKKINKTEKMIG